MCVHMCPACSTQRVERWKVRRLRFSLQLTFPLTFVVRCWVLASIRPHGLCRGCTIPALAPPPWAPACRGGWARPFANLGLCDPGGDDRAFAQGAVVNKKEENTSQYCGGLDMPNYAPAICTTWCPELFFQGFNHSGSFTWLLLVPWAHSCIIMTQEALAKLQKKEESEEVLMSLVVGSYCASGLSAAISQLGSTAQVSLHGFFGLLGTESTPVWEQSPSFLSVCSLLGWQGGMVVTEAEEHSFPSCTCWMASLCHWVQHCSSNHLKTSQLMCPLLSQKQQGRTPVQTSPCFPLLLQGEIKASEAPVPAWPGQDWLMVPIAFPSRQPDGSNESATSGLVKGIPPL